MSEKLWWVMLGLFVLAWILAIATESRVLAVVAVLIIVALAADTWHKYGRKGRNNG